MRKLLLPVLCVIAFVACQTEELTQVQPSSTEQNVLPKDEVWSLVQANMNGKEPFRWESLDNRAIYSAALSVDSLFSFGYWLGDKAEADQLLGIVDTDTEAWQAHLDDILAEVTKIESAARGKAVSRQELLPFGEPEFVPQVTLQLTSFQSVEFLRDHPSTRYFEPMGFEIDEFNPELGSRSAGCSGGAPNYSINPADFTTISPNAKMPWNFPLHKIPQAWEHSQGDNIGIQIIDTGSSDDQENLNAEFDGGLSNGRSVTRTSTYITGWWWNRRLEPPHDPCGHGTQMSGIATAPRRSAGNTLGVAWKADLTTVRAVSDVVISSSDESNGVKRALILAGNTSSTRIASLSLGTPFHNNAVEDGVLYAYNRGKMIFAAAGTSIWPLTLVGVVFPATMSETFAVTGVKQGSPFVKCHNCHEGSAVDFVIQMQRRDANDRVMLTLANSGNQPTYVGGSSCATATAAGIAALVWSKHPQLNRDLVFDRLMRSSSYFPNRNSKFGWGSIDAHSAVTLP